MEYILFEDEIIKPLNGKWTDKVDFIPAGSILTNLRKTTDGDFAFTIKETGVESLGHNPLRFIENTPENVKLLEEYHQKAEEISKLQLEMKDIFWKLTRFNNE